MVSRVQTIVITSCVAMTISSRSRKRLNVEVLDQRPPSVSWSISMVYLACSRHMGYACVEQQRSTVVHKTYAAIASLSRGPTTVLPFGERGLTLSDASCSYHDDDVVSRKMSRITKLRKSPGSSCTE